MPVTYQIDSANGIIRTRCAGEVTFDDIAGHFRELSEDPSCPGALDVLLDLTQNETLPNPSQLRSVGVEIDRIRDRVRFGSCAIVAGSAVVFGLMRMFEVFASGRFGAIRVFRDLDEAESWLRSQRP